MKECIKNVMIKILDMEYQILLSFYCEIREDAADYVIFVTRRCYILYHIFSYIEGWESLNSPTIISDRGIWFKRLDLQMASKILVVDDILWYGNTINNVKTKLRKYINIDCKIRTLVYCIFDNTLMNKEEIEYWCVRDRFACGQLSDRLVRCIIENGIPYSTFVYSWYGTAIDSKLDNLCSNENDSLIHTLPLQVAGNAWSQYYYFDLPERIQNVISCFSKSSCLRIYTDGANNYCIMPFSFVKSVKSDKIEDFFKNIQEIINNSGNKILSQEFENALHDSDKSYYEEKWPYLMTLLSCLLSRYIGIEMSLDKLFGNNYNAEIEKLAIMGSFPERVTDEIINLDKNFTDNFTQQVKNYYSKWDEYFIKDSLPDRKLDSKEEMTCVDALISIFHNKRIEFDNSQDEEKKYLTCSEILENLYSKSYTKNEIYAAQISCWDQGIAGYVFKYIAGKGIISINGLGERSSLIISLRNKKSLDKYFSWELRQSNKNIKEEEREEKLKEILQCDKASQEDQKILLNNMNNLYQYYLL